MRIRLALAMMAAGAPALSAQASPDSVLRSGPIRVHAVRATTTAGGASALHAVPDSLTTSAAPTMEQVLREMPFVHVRTNSRGEAQFSLRGSGSDARQVAVLVDGVPLNLGWDDRADLSVLPATAAASLTLVRGLPSVLYGANVLGGVVEVNVAQGPGTGVAAPFVEARLGGDHTGSFTAGATAAVPVSLERGAFSLRAGAGFRDRRGLALPGGVAQPGSATLRTNTAMQHRDAFVAARFIGTGGAWASLASSAFEGERGIAPELHTSRPRYWRYPEVGRWVTALTLGTGDRASPLGGRGDAEVSVGYDVGSTSIRSYEDVTYRTVIDTEDSDDRTVTVRLLADQMLGARGELRTAFSHSTIEHDEVLAFDAQRNSYEQRVWSAAAETVWRLAAPLAAFTDLRVSIGGALDGADTPRSGDKPPLGTLHDWGARLGVSAVAADGSTVVHAGASRRARFPALRELYSGALGRFVPNPELRPELLHAAEAGVTTALSRVDVQAVAFYRVLDDAIEQVSLPGRMRQRVNLGTVRSTGLELLAATAAGPLDLAADITLQRVRLGGEADVRPEYQPAFSGGLDLGARLPHGFSAGAELRHISAQYCVNPEVAGSLRLDPSTRLDAHLSRGFALRRSGLGSHLDIGAGVDNVTDSAVYDQCGLPQAGRTLQLSVRIR